LNQEADFLRILQTVVVKQVLTEKSKRELLEIYQKKVTHLQRECESLKFEQKKFEKSNKVKQIQVQKHFDNEIKQRVEKLEVLAFQIEQLNLLPLGSEIKEKEIQAIVDVRIGDNWENLSKAAEIVIKDGIVNEIR
jgi:hypothetical protein